MEIVCGILREDHIPVAQWIEQRFSKPLVTGSSPVGNVCGRNSVGRVIAFQAICRGFEPLRPLS